MSDRSVAQSRSHQLADQPIPSTSGPVKEPNEGRERLLRWLAVLVARAIRRARNGDNVKEKPPNDYPYFPPDI